MPLIRIQFQTGVSLPECFRRYGTEEQCAAALKALRWPYGFCFPRCDSAAYYVVGHVARKLFQCRGCHHQASSTAGTLVDRNKLPLRTWFLAIFLISQDKTGLSSPALMRPLGASYRTVWFIQQKLIATMAQRDSEQPLTGDVQVDDAYLGGERLGVGGRGSLSKVPIVAAVATNDEGHPIRVKVPPVASFSRQAIANWACTNLVPGCVVRSDGLNCFAGVSDAGYAHSFIVVSSRKPRAIPQFNWVNTVLGNLKTMIHGAQKAFDFGKYATSYLGAFAYHFNARFDLRELLGALAGPRRSICAFARALDPGYG